MTRLANARMPLPAAGADRRLRRGSGSRPAFFHATTSALLFGLIAALLLLQTLGVVHAVVHPTAQGLSAWRQAALAVPASTAAPADRRQAADVAGASTTVTSPKRTGGWANALFAGHDAGSSACALYDQLVQPALALDTACSTNPAFAPPLPAEPPRIGQLAPQAVGFLARGPPPSRPTFSA